MQGLHGLESNEKKQKNNEGMKTGKEKPKACFSFLLERTMMEKIKERTGSVAMKELAIQEKEVNTRWQGFRGRLLMIKVKKEKPLNY